MKKLLFAYAKTKAQISYVVATQLNSTFVFTVTIPLLCKSKISSLQPYSVVVQHGLCWTCSEIQKGGFLMMQLITITLLDLKT